MIPVLYLMRELVISNAEDLEICYSTFLKFCEVDAYKTKLKWEQLFKIMFLFIYYN
jgi:hypothetical protein